MDYIDSLRITTGAAVDPLIHGKSYPRSRDTQCHAQSHVVHMHNWCVPAAGSAYPQYPQGLLTLLIPSFLFIQITSPLLHPCVQTASNASSSTSLSGLPSTGWPGDQFVETSPLDCCLPELRHWIFFAAKGKAEPLEFLVHELKSVRQNDSPQANPSGKLREPHPLVSGIRRTCDFPGFC